MGFFTASAPVTLHPVNPPVGVHGHYCVQVPTTLVLKEKVFSFSGDDFAIKDANGQTVVRCQGKALSFRDRKEGRKLIRSTTVITDPNGRTLFTIRNKMIAIHKTFVGEDEHEKEVFRIKKRLGLGTKMEAVFINHSTGAETTLELRGDFWGGSADITIHNGSPVAQISRQLFNARQIFGDQQTYYVTVAPGVDLSLIAAVCICFDEAKNEEKN